MNFNLTFELADEHVEALQNETGWSRAKCLREIKSAVWAQVVNTEVSSSLYVNSYTGIPALDLIADKYADDNDRRIAPSPSCKKPRRGSK